MERPVIAAAIDLEPSSQFMVVLQLKKDQLMLNSSLPIAGFSPPSENDSGILENLVIVVKNYILKTHLKQFADSLVSPYKSSLQNFQLIELNPLTTPALNSSYKIEYTHSSDMLMLKTMEVWTINGGIANMISYNADSSDFSNYLPII
jgi:hypothetical protein